MSQTATQTRKVRTVQVVPPNNIDCHDLDALYSHSVAAKIWSVAARSLDDPTPPESMPEYTLPKENNYTPSHASFWTSGFFPGSIHLLYERQQLWPQVLPKQLTKERLQQAGRWWTENLHKEAGRTDSHDLGFMIQPWAQVAWKLDQNKAAFDSLMAAANALASRFDPRVGAIRSWDTCFTKRYAFADPKDDYLVIIDNMMNLDLLYLVAELTNDQRLANIATQHATTTIRSHIRDDDSTCHVVNFEQTDGSIKERITNQGFSDASCWTRGQAWGVTGFAQCHRRTGNVLFLETSRRLADYFLKRLGDNALPPWDFDAPNPGPPDSSAAVILAYGLLLLHEAIPGDELYLASALRIVRNVISTALAPAATFVEAGSEAVESVHDTILIHATINNYEFAPRKWADHGLVYADYYFLLLGNKLLEMGLTGGAV